jgi:hypothetical protein
MSSQDPQNQQPWQGVPPTPESGSESGQPESGQAWPQQWGQPSAGEPPAAPPSASYPTAPYPSAYPPAYPYGTPAPYGPPGTGVAPTDDKAVWALVSAIAGFVICPIILHIVGWVLANQSLQAVHASGGALGGEGLAKAARILSIVGLVLYGAGILLFLLVTVVAVVGAANSGMAQPFST